MMNLKCIARLLLPTALLFVSCNEGLSPSSTTPPTPTGNVSGVVRFTNWDSAGTVVDIRLVLFRNFPPNDIVGEVIGGQAVVYPVLGAGALVPFGADSIQYNLELAVGTYQYVAIAQQFGPNNLADWRAVGQYDLDTNLTVPTSIVITVDDTTSGIDVNVDFDNLPPPPF
ncbi:MAG: hypothetical protein ACKVRP_07440 [Bacteroidota bacterium]